MPPGWTNPKPERHGYYTPFLMGFHQEQSLPQSQGIPQLLPLLDPVEEAQHRVHLHQ